MNSTNSSKKGSLYQTVWRWHFYAGILVAPLLFMLSITGAVYVFKPQIEQWLYHDYYEVTPASEKLTASQQLDAMRRLYPDVPVLSYTPGETAERTSEFHVTEDGTGSTVFLNPYTGESTGTLTDQDRIMDRIEALHGELMIGTIGDRIVELTACWTIVLLITGLYLWKPKSKWRAGGMLYPRLRKGSRLFWRDFHAVPAFYLSAGLLFLVMTGLPWSGFWGTNFQILTTNTGEGYPPSVWIGNAPKSGVQTKEIAEVPWAAETLPVPLSEVKAALPVSLDHIAAVAQQKQIHPGYTVYFPQQEDGVFTISAFPPKAQDEATIHIDQYTGAVLADYRYVHYGWIGKAVAWGITIHKGHQFGLLNQLVNLVLCLGIAAIVFSGLYLWRKRKPAKALGAPPANRSPKSFLLLLAGVGLLFPLVGLSLLAVGLIDFVFKKIRRQTYE